MFEYNATITKIVDGDTIDLDIDLGFDIHTKQRIRLARINCPEMKTDEGVAAKCFVVMNFPVLTPVKVTTSKTDIYGRYIGEVTVKFGGEDKNLSDLIVGNGFGTYVKY